MTPLLSLAAVALLLLFGLGLLRIRRGPTEADRILAIQLSGTSTVGMLLLLSFLLAMPALLYVALIFVLFAAMVAIAFVRISQSDDG